MCPCHACTLLLVSTEFRKEVLNSEWLWNAWLSRAWPGDESTIKTSTFLVPSADECKRSCLSLKIFRSRCVAARFGKQFQAMSKWKDLFSFREFTFCLTCNANEERKQCGEIRIQPKEGQAEKLVDAIKMQGIHYHHGIKSRSSCIRANFEQRVVGICIGRELRLVSLGTFKPLGSLRLEGMPAVSIQKHQGQHFFLFKVETLSLPASQCRRNSL